MALRSLGVLTTAAMLFDKSGGLRINSHDFKAAINKARA
jgi:hypothetical protein